MYGVPHHSNKARGGKVEGPGTGTSDSIKKDVATGSFIMPADSTAKLGINPEMIRQYQERQAAQSGPRLGVLAALPLLAACGPKTPKACLADAPIPDPAHRTAGMVRLAGGDFHYQPDQKQFR